MEPGKLSAPPRVEAVGESAEFKRFHIRDLTSGLEFLVDSGAEISLIPVTDANARPAELQLFAVNNTPIKTFEEKRSFSTSA